MGITWLSSYPKSGNTWVRFMIANMLEGPLDSTESLQSIVPDMHEPLVPPDSGIWYARETQVAKTHLVYQDSPGMRATTEGFIHVVRNPLDVLASCLNFRRLSGQQAHDGSVDAESQRAAREYVSAFLESGGDPEWQKIGFGSWADHVRSWSEAEEKHPSLLLRYEDVLADPLAAASEINEFLGLGLEAQAVRQAVEASSFESMRAIEDREVEQGTEGFFAGHRAADDDSGVRFMHRGRSGGGRELLTDDEIARALAVFGDTMRDLGYGTDL